MVDAPPKAKTPPKAQAACFLRRVAGHLEPKINEEPQQKFFKPPVFTHEHGV
jgi:hypothetical protein